MVTTAMHGQFVINIFKPCFLYKIL